MITVTIKKETIRSFKANENLLVKETPTEYTEDAYSKKTVVMAKEYAVAEVDRRELKTITLLEQNIEDDADFNLAAVIMAINGISEESVLANGD